MEFMFDLGLAGLALLIVGALAFAIVAPLTGRSVEFEGVVDAVAAFGGAFVASEFVIAWRTFEPVWDGVALIPALIGGLVVGIVADLLMRLAFGGTPSGRPMSA
jgi:uncharacterized membrane protein YeaQ/YmgE (transglycosylase-associated protein family)